MRMKLPFQRSYWERKSSPDQSSRKENRTKSLHTITDAKMLIPHPAGLSSEEFNPSEAAMLRHSPCPCKDVRRHNEKWPDRRKRSYIFKNIQENVTVQEELYKKKENYRFKTHHKLPFRKSSVHPWPWASHLCGCIRLHLLSLTLGTGPRNGTHIDCKQTVPLNATYVVPYRGKFLKYTRIPIKAVILFIVNPI